MCSVMMEGGTQPGVARLSHLLKFPGLEPVPCPFHRASSSPTHPLLHPKLWYRLVTPGDRVSLGFMGQHYPGPKSLGARLGAKEGAGQGPVKDIWDRMGSGHREVLSCGTRTPDGLQPGTWISNRHTLKGG